MEQDLKRHTLVFNKGLSFSQSNLICDDNTLSECDGITIEDGEWKPIQSPLGKFILDGKLLYVHRGEGYRNYIFYSSETGLSYYNDNEEETLSMDVPLGMPNSVKAVGNTLVVNADNAIHYILWKENDYKYLGTKIPELDVKFHMGTTKLETAKGNVLGSADAAYNNMRIIEQESYNNVVHGAYALAKSKLEKDKKFSLPFMVTASVKLCNGTYTMMTAPVVMMPSVHRSVHFNYVNANGGANIEALVWGAELMLSQGTDYSDWKDIVSNITIFASRGVEVMSLDEDCLFERDFVGNLASDRIINGKYIANYITDPIEVQGTSIKVQCLHQRDSKDVAKDLAESSVFYKLCDLNTSPHENTNVSATMTGHTLVNLEVQDRMNDIEYFSHCNITMNSMYGGMETYNRRLNIWDVERGFFEGFGHFMSYTSTPTTSPVSRQYKILVSINTPSGLRYVVRDVTTDELFIQEGWWYYPDPRATKLEVFVNVDNTWRKCFDIDLTEHPGLNGAYSFEDMPTGTDAVKLDGRAKSSFPSAPLPEPLPSYLLQSEVDNPFTFSAGGYVRVGQGEIIGIGGLTTALSQDAYMVATTLAFTTQGIWGLKVNGEGRYEKVDAPFSREVCVNPKSIAMTDNAVFFASKKGLMCVTGEREDRVVCMSEQFNNYEPFHSVLENMNIAYDYRAYLLYVFELSSQTRLERRAFVYNIKTGMWSTHRGIFGGNLQSVVNDYPDTLVQNSNNVVHSFYEKPSRENDGNEYQCTIISRPLKLDGSTIIKSIRRVKHLIMDKETIGGFYVYGSNRPNDDTFVDVDSARGKGYRFFRLGYFFIMGATDTFNGTIVETQVKHTDKLR